MTTLTRFAVLWGLVLLFFLVFTPLVANALWLFYGIFYWGVAAAGAFICLVALTRCVRSFRAALPVLLIGILGLSVFFTSGFQLGRVAYFQLRKAHYEQLLAWAIDAKSVPREHGTLDEGPPVRYAFYWEKGLLDNWIGLVYDPTDQVMAVNQAEGFTDLDDPRWAESVNLFGGTLYKCEALEGHWYLCWFT